MGKISLEDLNTKRMSIADDKYHKRKSNNYKPSFPPTTTLNPFLMSFSAKCTWQTLSFGPSSL
jgi:hypothetical protein